MTTFSQIVDDLVLEHLRPDLLTSIVSYVNQTIREVHAQRNTAAPILFSSNRVEEEWTVAAVPAVWPIPSVARFQRLETAYCSILNAYFLERHLSKIHTEQFNPETRYFWYRTGPAIAFGDRYGSSINGLTLNLSYFMFPKLLKYYPAASRPATYDPETEEFTYADGIVTDEEKLEAEEKVTNWILLRWGEAVIKQGTRAKIFTRLGEERAKLAYSSFESMREAMHSAEAWQQNPG